MPVAVFNSQAQTALAKHLRDALEQIILRNGSVPSWTREFASSKKSILKYKGEWLDDFDASIIISEVVGRSLPADAASTTGPLSDFLDADKIASVVLEVVAYVASIPKNYEIDFPLPKIDITQEVVFSSHVSLIRSLPTQTNALRGLRRQGPTPATHLSNTTYLRIAASGFARDELRQSAMKDAQSHMKRFFQVACVKNAFVREIRRDETQIMAELFGAQPTVPVHRAIIRDLSDNTGVPSYVNLGGNLSSYLDSIALHTVRTGLSRPPVRVSNAVQDLLALLAMPMALLVDPRAEENCKSFRSALEWQFDAEVDDEPLSSFIKTCIGLEAALGEDSDEDRITERLADRCAYLLHSIPVERAKTREAMRGIYKLRSKLVHGQKTRLSEADTKLAFYGKVHLQLVLHKEIQTLESWWVSLIA